MTKQRRLAAALLPLGAVTTMGLALAQSSATGMDHMDHSQAAGPTQAAVGPAAEAQRGYNAAKTNILKSADRMPTADFSYKPEPDIRTFARVLNHVTEAQLRSCGLANGTPASSLPKVPPETADKATIVGALQASFAECDKAFAALTDSNLAEMFTMGPAKRSRIGLMWGTVAHDNEQYSTLALYLRLKGIAPPSSEH